MSSDHVDDTVARLVELAGMPAHNHPERLPLFNRKGCPACEFVHLAIDIDWPDWAIPHDFIGDVFDAEAKCARCQKTAPNEIHGRPDWSGQEIRK